MKTDIHFSDNTLYLFYDGDCILCRNTAQAIRIKKSVGNIALINARESSPLIRHVNDKGYDLNEGIVTYYNGQYLFGPDAIHFLAFISSNSDLFNRINATLFKYKWPAQLLYPVFKSLRNAILFLRKIPPLTISKQKALIDLLFGDQAQNIPLVLQKRYFLRPYSNDKLSLRGEMNVTTSWFFRLLSPLFKLSGALVPYEAQTIPVTVKFSSNVISNKISMERTFYYSKKFSYQFNSQFIHMKDNIIIEIMKFGFASKLIYRFDHDKIIMEYGGYLLCIAQWHIPLPLGWLIGKFYADEAPISETEFSMLVSLTHPVFGKLFQYDGRFKIEGSNQ